MYRVNNMIEVAPASPQEIRVNWGIRTDVDCNENTAPRISLDVLRRAGHQKRSFRNQNRQHNRRIRQSSLFRIKETELFVSPLVEIASFTRQSCQTCTPVSRGTFLSAKNQYQQFEKNMFHIDPKPGFFPKIFPDVAFIYNRKSYNYPRVTQSVLSDGRIKDVSRKDVHATANQTISEAIALADTTTCVKSILMRMESCINHIVIAITGWFTCKLVPLFIRSIIVQNYQIEMIQKANKRGVPLIFLPLHRSHIDYMCIGYLLLSINVRNCLVAAGINLNIPVFGKLLSGLGAFYIKRRIDSMQGHKDVLYREILCKYVMESLRAGHNMEFFIEGGRTRTGKPRMPKAGILSIIVSAYKNGTIEDALIIPMSINYERLVDGNFVKEQLGQPKIIETFGATIKAIWKTFQGSYGYVKCDFCEPFSLHEIVKSTESQITRSQANTLTDDVPKFMPIKTKSNSSLYNSDIDGNNYKLLINRIAQHVIYDSGKSTAIMSTNIVAFLLLNKFRNGCTMDELIEAFDSLWQELEYLHKNIAFCGETLDIVNHALEVLGPGLITQHRKVVTKKKQGEVKKKIVIVIHPISILPNIIELSYYSNSMTVHYVMDSIVISALHAVLKTQINDPQSIAQNEITIPQTDLIEKALKLCDILQQEFIFCKPCEDLEKMIFMTIQNLTYAGIIRLFEGCYLEEELWSRKYAENFNHSSDEEYKVQNFRKKIQYKLNLDAVASTRMEFLHTILRPLIDTYAFSAFTLTKLTDRYLLESDLVQEILDEIKINIDSGIANYGESFSIDPIKSSLSLFEKWHILDYHIEGNVKIYYLQNTYNDDIVVNQLYVSIGIYKWTKQKDTLK